MELDLKSAQTTQLNLNWIYDILDLDLKNNETNLMNSDLNCYNQVEMLLEKYKKLLGLSVK